MNKFFMCFAIQNNMAAIMNTRSPKGSITSLNGIRVITISWVIIGHVYMSIAKFPIGNLLFLYISLFLTILTFVFK